MKQYQLYVRRHELEKWLYAGPCLTATEAWEGMMLARSHNLQARVTISGPAVLDMTTLEARS